MGRLQHHHSCALTSPLQLLLGLRLQLSIILLCCLGCSFLPLLLMYDLRAVVLQQASGLNDLLLLLLLLLLLTATSYTRAVRISRKYPSCVQRHMLAAHPSSVCSSTTSSTT
jgi:hypothetical protein